ncbi:3-deoxy-D-manno-octulosonic acid transferase [Alteromonas flava]|uniref:3-deoxy-D-manno-octulosonic acid transferase n=1 Tax=Alteromonas flava TaxID=2048003 RepID=UPI000C287346|nr:3-deoxy-D-manno-octulosonic acid transferase [Alteromonas flava]
MQQSAPNNEQNTPSVWYRIQLFLYNLMWTILLPLLFLIFMVKWAFRRPDYSQRRLSRFAIFSQGLSRCDILWHCVSVGEVTAVTPLIKALLEQQHDLKITITTTTPTGAEQVQRSLGQQVQHCFLPYDHYGLMHRLVSKLRPQLLIVTEVEIWPSLLAICSAKKIPSILVNARMTDRSAKRYAKLGQFLAHTLQQFNYINAQSGDDQERYITLGANATNTQNTGNIKFEIQSQRRQDPWVLKLADLAQERQAPIVVAGSTHAPEEEIILAAHQRLKQTTSNLITCIVPRHPQRFNEVKELLINKNIHFASYSDGDIAPDATVLLIDAMGVLHDLYAIADIAFVGGSFADRGGHNALEPALYEVPVVMGPSQYNNPTITAHLATAGALKTVLNEQQLLAEIQHWLTTAAARKQAGKQGLEVINANRGAVAANLLLINQLLDR